MAVIVIMRVIILVNVRITASLRNGSNNCIHSNTNVTNLRIQDLQQQNTKISIQSNNGSNSHDWNFLSDTIILIIAIIADML